MVITYQGDNYFKIQSGGLTFLVDPTSTRSFRGADIILNTLKPAPVEKSESEAFFIDYQGEYEMAGARIKGFSVESDPKFEKTAYRVEIDDIVLVFLGHLSKELSPALEEHFRGASVVFIPVGGKPYLSAAAAAKIVRHLEPGIVIPSLFDKDPKNFLKEFGVEKRACEEKLVFKNKDIKPGAMEIKCLKV